MRSLLEEEEREERRESVTSRKDSLKAEEAHKRKASEELADQAVPEKQRAADQVRITMLH